MVQSKWNDGFFSRVQSIGLIIRVFDFPFSTMVFIYIFINPNTPEDYMTRAAHTLLMYYMYMYLKESLLSPTTSYNNQ